MVDKLAGSPIFICMLFLCLFSNSFIIAGSKSETDWQEFVAIVGYSEVEVQRWDEEVINVELANIGWAGRRKGGVKNYWNALRQGIHIIHHPRFFFLSARPENRPTKNACAVLKHHCTYPC